METYIRPPEPLSGNGNMAQNWQRWKKDFLIYLKASNNIKQSKDVRAYLLRSHIGTVGAKAIEKIIVNSNDRDNINVLLAKLDTYFEPPKREIVERYKFFTRSWGKGESLEDYIDDLKKKATTCNFGHIMNSLIRDKVIADITDKGLRNKLFEAENLDLFRLILICNEHKMTTQEKKQVSKNTTADPNTKMVNNTNPKNIGNVNSNVNTTKLLEQNPGSNNREYKKQCWRCHQRHSPRSCPAWGFKCEKCGERNHYTQCCQHVNNERKEVHKFKTNANDSSNFHMNLQKNNLQTSSMQYNSMGGYVRPSYSGHPNTSPSAPQLLEYENALYPDLNNMKMSEKSEKSWSWVEQNKNSNENFQKNKAPTPKSETERQYDKRNMERTNVTDSNTATSSSNSDQREAKAVTDSCKIS